MRLMRSPRIVRQFFPSVLWCIGKKQSILYLTFDDGPSERTQELLEILEKFNAKATFFCVGQNVERLPEDYQAILSQGHEVGNHSFSHKKGWRTSKKAYLDDVQKAKKVIDSKLFRPPYGKMTLSQYRTLIKEFRVVMWTHLSYDFDNSIPADSFVERLKRDFQGGEIVVLHDNIKYFDRSKYMLIEILKWAKKREIRCEAIPQ